jgi:uncharacterized protein YkwD
MKKLSAFTLTLIILLTLTVTAVASEFTSSDALAILRHTAGVITLSETDMQRFDLNNDGKVDSADALIVLRIVAGIHTQTTTDPTLEDKEKIVFNMINEERIKAGLPLFIWDDALARAARDHSIDQNTNNFMSHIGSDGSDDMGRAMRAGFTGEPWSISEIIAFGGYLRAVSDWLNSPMHKIIMLSNRNVAGVGINGNVVTVVIGDSV